MYIISVFGRLYLLHVTYYCLIIELLFVRTNIIAGRAWLKNDKMFFFNFLYALKLQGPSAYLLPPLLAVLGGTFYIVVIIDVLSACMSCFEKNSINFRSLCCFVKF